MLRAPAVLTLLLLVAALPPMASAGLHFHEPTLYSVGSVQSPFPFGSSNPFAIARGDFDDDGHVDVATVESVSQSTDPTLTILYGTGTGNLEDIAVFDIDAPARYLAAGDFDEDGLDDLLVPGPSRVELWLNDGAGGFDALDHALAAAPYGVVAGDFDGDDHLDAGAAASDGSLALLVGDGDGGLAAAVPYAAGQGSSGLAAGDVNGDGRDDLLSVGSSVSVLLGNADGTLAAAVASPYASCCAGRPVLGRLNADASDDVLLGGGATGGFIELLLGGTSAALGTAMTIPGPDTGGPGLGDFNGDGELDLVTASTSNGKFAVAFGTGNATFGPRTVFEPGGTLSNPAGLDVDEDGFDDALVLEHSTGSLAVAVNAPAAVASPAALSFPVTPIAASAAPLTVTVTNDGQPPLTLGTPAILGAGEFQIASQNCAGATLAAGSACSIAVGFRPLAPFTPPATLVVPSNGGSLGIPLSGTSPTISPSDVSAPDVGVRIRRQTLAEVIKRGLAARVSCNETCTVRARVILARKVARRLGLGRRVVVAGETKRTLPAGTATIRVKLTRRVRAKLRDVDSVKVALRIVATDAAGNDADETRSVTLRR